ncbi:cis-prenyltransferase [Cryptotrichosporon argae]
MSRHSTRTPTPSLPLRLASLVLRTVHAALTSLVLALLACGPVPAHVGFVMDGNRRYARVRGRAVSRGHEAGFESLKRTLQLCLRLNIRVVSVYAFSIENFSRPKDEVDALMELAKRSLLGLATAGDFLDAHGVRVKCVGRQDLLSADVRDALREVEEKTRHNVGGVLNVCGPYTSRDEITTAVRDTLEAIDGGALDVSDIMSDRIFANLETSRAAAAVSAAGGKLDILVRTSDVKRLSDFMMWQAAEDTQIHFVKTYWPEFGLSDMLPILLGWQQKIWLQRLGSQRGENT